MQTFPKSPNHRKKRSTAKQFIARCKSERERWNGLEDTKALRFRNVGKRYRVRGY